MTLEIISLVLNLVLGGSLIVTIATLKSVRVESDAKAKKAIADAKSNELENVEAAIKIWRDTANEMAEKHTTILKEMEALRKEVARLNRINSKIEKLLNRINKENIEDVVAEIKSEMHTNG